MSKSVPHWLESRMYFVKVQGKMLLSGETNIDLSRFESPQISKTLSLMKYLDVSKTPLESVEGLGYHKKLICFVANNSSISSFRNFKSLRSVTSISLIGTPLSKVPNYKLSLLLVIGNQLNSIDGKLVPNSIREKAKSYSSIAGDLINVGWAVEYPCPSIETLNNLCQEYGIQCNPKITHPIDIEMYNDLNRNFYSGDFETTLQELKKKHEELLKQGQALFGLIDEDEDDEDTALQISTIFHSHGISIPSNDQETIIETVQSLCNQTPPK